MGSVGRVHYANYLKPMGRASEWLRSRGFEHDELMRVEGIGFVVRRVMLGFIKPGRFNQLLTISSKIIQCGRASLALGQKVLSEGLTLCAGTVKLACLDAASLRPHALSAAIRREIADAV